MGISFDWRRFGRFFLAIMFLFLADIGQAHAQGCSGVPTSTTGAVTWNPQWCQEFNATTAGPPDTTVWSFDLGNSGFGNNEIETYCGPPGYANNPSTCPTTFSAANSNAYVDGSGHLLIQAINTGGTWFSARMKTQGLENFQYGRIEGSIQLPNTSNQGLWPAFWSLGSDINTTPWPACGEVDFMENWSPQVFNGPGPAGNKTTIHTQVTAGNGIGRAFTFPAGQQADSSFHSYGTIWSANLMQFYIDDPTKPFLIETPSDLSAGDTWPFNAQLFLLANIAVGGTLGGTPSGLTPNPGVMIIDYVRQYQLSAPISPPTMGTPPAISIKAGAMSGNTSTFTPGLTPATGYVYFSCSTNAPKASCAISTTDPLDKFVVSSSASESVTVTVTTTANAATVNWIPPSLFFNPGMPVWLPLSMAGLLALMAVASLRKRLRLYSCMLAAGLILTGAGTSSCGGGSSNAVTTTTPVTPIASGTPAGAYTVTVYAFTESNAKDGSNANADASVSIPLTVN